MIKNNSLKNVGDSTNQFWRMENYYVINLVIYLRIFIITKVEQYKMYSLRLWKNTQLNINLFVVVVLFFTPVSSCSFVNTITS